MLGVLISLWIWSFDIATAAEAENRTSTRLPLPLILYISLVLAGSIYVCNTQQVRVVVGSLRILLHKKLHGHEGGSSFILSELDLWTHLEKQFRQDIALIDWMIGRSSDVLGSTNSPINAVVYI